MCFKLFRPVTNMTVKTCIFGVFSIGIVRYTLTRCITKVGTSLSNQTGTVYIYRYFVLSEYVRVGMQLLV